MFCNDQFLRARKRLGVFVVLSKKPLGAGKVEGKKAKSPAETAETIVEKENEEEVEKKEETGERQEAPVIRKSKRIAKGKGKVIYPMNSKKKKDLPQLDEVTRKRRKLLDSSTAAAIKAKVCSFFFWIDLFSFVNSFLLCILDLRPIRHNFLGQRLQS